MDFTDNLLVVDLDTIMIERFYVVLISKLINFTD